MILELEKQVCDLDSARRLKELGFIQESLFYWNPKNGRLRYGFESYIDEKGLMQWFISAYTTTELGIFLPKYMNISTFCTEEDYWICSDNEKICFTDLKEVEARARMLIYLTEQGLIKPNP